MMMAAFRLSLGLSDRFAQTLRCWRRLVVVVRVRSRLCGVPEQGVGG